MIGLTKGLGYSLSCLTTLYPVDRQASSRPFADSPVIPVPQDARHGPWAWQSLRFSTAGGSALELLDDE